MALRKTITTENGLPLEYHRVALVIIEPNQQTTVLVHSYLNEEARDYEKAYARGEIKGKPTFPYVHAEYMNFSYREDMTMKNAYGCLKKLPKFEGAEDV